MIKQRLHVKQTTHKQKRTAKGYPPRNSQSVSKTTTGRGIAGRWVRGGGGEWVGGEGGGVKPVLLARNLTLIMMQLQFTHQCSVCIRSSTSSVKHQSEVHIIKTTIMKQNKASIKKTYLYNFDTLIPHIYIVKLGFTRVYIVFLISAQKHRLWVAEAVLTSTHNQCFEQKYKKNISFFFFFWNFSVFGGEVFYIFE